MSHTRVNAAAVRIEAADDHVIDPNQRNEHAHQRDQPERSVTGNGKGETDHVGFARAPVAVQDRGRARHIDIARPLNVGWYQLINSTQNEADSRDEAPHFKWSRIYDIPCILMMLTRLAVGLEPLNTLDAAHRSPRSVFRNWVPR